MNAGRYRDWEITRREFLTVSLLALGSRHALADIGAEPAFFGARPSPRQLHWQRMETNAFLHFTVNTFTDREWGNGDEDPAVFNPGDFDADAIVLALKSGGMKGVILTCKHHDGFCLWPTRTTNHSIRFSPWMAGKGDVVREVSDAARRHGLKFGVYLSPWDRNNAEYGRPAYLATYRQQLTELLTLYGSVFEVWFDGANGGSGYYGGARETRTIDKHTYYDWPTTWALVRKLQPEAVIFSDAGPDVRWVGNEDGSAGESSWATCDPLTHKGAPGVPGDSQTDVLNRGTRFGSRWLPAECDVSIRPGWFWHEREDGQVKTPDQLLDLYFRSVGRGANLLLNVPPNRQGRISPQDMQALAEFYRRVQATFAENLAVGAKLKPSNVRGKSSRFDASKLVDGLADTYWATDNAVHTPELTVDFGRKVQFNVLRLREAIQIGQRIGALSVDVWQQDAWKQVAEATSIGSCRLIRLSSPFGTTRLRLRITDSAACVALAELGVFLQA